MKKDTSAINLEKEFLQAHIVKTNNTICKIFLFGCLFPFFILVMSLLDVYNYPLKLAVITFSYSISSCCLSFFLKRVLPPKVFQYVVTFLLQVIVLLLSLDLNLNVTVTFLLVPLFTIMYFNPPFTLYVCFLSTITVVSSLYFTSEQAVEMFWHDITPFYCFLTQLSGALMEMVMATVLLFFTTRYSRSYMLSVHARNQKVTEIQNQLVFCFADIIESKEVTTGQHVKRTSAVVSLLTDYLSKKGSGYMEDMSLEDMNIINTAAPLHDIGKIKVSNYILCKPGRLTPEEFEMMKCHSLAGGEMITATLNKVEDPRFIEIACQMATYHHEKWDGSGYPMGLREKEIPFSARIMAIADVLDALKSDRPYKKAFSMDETYRIIEESRNKHFDPILVDAIIELRPEIEKIYPEYEAI